ncbi:hypothetical protein CYMTET_10146 [Cymbomonas tetramitiformis]|uniref:Uncharacterized protein n=1 Tax=Cymbomonas tetramitiformis TaxID=36881 RepID=A0AAE0GPR1_9CHLO|nr:hypothetical protein CYMTET_10146 [Cymbomonas tetramitiformis]
MSVSDNDGRVDKSPPKRSASPKGEHKSSGGGVAIPPLWTELLLLISFVGVLDKRPLEVYTQPSKLNSYVYYLAVMHLETFIKEGALPEQAVNSAALEQAVQGFLLRRQRSLPIHFWFAFGK